MFSYADVDGDGHISWSEFQTMINPPRPADQWATRPTMADLVEKTSLLHPHTLSATAILSSGAAHIPLSQIKPVLGMCKVGPLADSDTHISASWAQIGLPTPATRK